MMFPKDIYWRSKEYLNFIDSKPCIVPGCGKKATHHHENLGMGGTSIKAPDSHCVPLCEDHHIPGVHAAPKSFWNLHDIDVVSVIIFNILGYLDIKGFVEEQDCITEDWSIDTVKKLTEYMHIKGV